MPATTATILSEDTAEVEIRRWGASHAIVIPAEIFRNLGYRDRERIVVHFPAPNRIKEIFGRFKDWKVDTQKLKDEAREGWGD